MANILYISLTGMTEPLGESQVLQYLIDLAKHNSIYLLSFEKPTDKHKIHQIYEKIQNANIRWKHYTYSNRMGVLSSFWQIQLAFLTLIKIIKKENIAIIHARSFVAGVIGMLLKKICKIKFIYDIRGFALEEKIIFERLKAKSFLTKLLQKLDAYAYRNSDHVVTLTHASKPLIHQNYYVKNEIISVIPTCADEMIFKLTSQDEIELLKKKLGFDADDIIILHNGSLNHCIDFEAEVKLFKQLSKLNSNIKFLILNNGQHETIDKVLSDQQIDKKDYKLIAVDFNDVYRYLNIADVCVFFIKPSLAKQASAPTKFAELVACHTYSVTNTKYGDMEYYLNSYKVGMLLDLQDVHIKTEKTAEHVLTFITETKTRPSPNNEFRSLFNEHFTKQIAIERYQKIYDSFTV